MFLRLLYQGRGHQAQEKLLRNNNDDSGVTVSGVRITINGVRDMLAAMIEEVGGLARDFKLDGVAEEPEKAIEEGLLREDYRFGYNFGDYHPTPVRCSRR